MRVLEMKNFPYTKTTKGLITHLFPRGNYATKLCLLYEKNSPPYNMIKS